MGLVNYNHNLPGCPEPQVVVPVLDNLIVQPFQHQQHLRVGHRVIFVRQQRLEVEHNKVLLGADGSRSVPESGVSAACGEFGNVVQQHGQIGLAVRSCGHLKIVEDLFVQIVKGGVVLRPQPAKVRLTVNSLGLIHADGNIVQILQGIRLDTG